MFPDKMINEYLFSTDEDLAKVKEYKSSDVDVKDLKISDINNIPLWIVACSSKRIDINSAEKLSDIHTQIMQMQPPPLILSCESSEYFNKKLFPLINELERKLRKLLYLVASISDNEEAKRSIEGLEKKKIGEIFDLLFIDQEFIKTMKKRVNAEKNSGFEKKQNYTKADIRSYLDELTEHTLWDAIFSDEDVPTLRSRFREVQSYRNDVMHAHNIDKEEYEKARRIFKEVNTELVSSIEKYEKDKSVKTKSDVNAAISSALESMDFSSKSEILKASAEVSAQLLQILKSLPPLDTTAGLSVFAEALRNSNPFLDSPVINGLKKSASQLNEAMKPFRQVGETMRSNVPSSGLYPSPSGLSFTSLVDKSDESDKPDKLEADNDELEEDTLDEQQ